MTFLEQQIAKLKIASRKIDRQEDPIKDIKEQQTTQVEVPWDTKLYSIYKRSLPVHINYPVLMNLPEEDAKRALRRLKTKEHTDPDGGKHAVYYDMVLQSDERQKSVYWNDKPVIIREGESEVQANKQLEIMNGPDKFQETWVG